MKEIENHVQYAKASLVEQKAEELYDALSEFGRLSNFFDCEVEEVQSNLMGLQDRLFDLRLKYDKKLFNEPREKYLQERREKYL